MMQGQCKGVSGLEFYEDAKVLRFRCAFQLTAAIYLWLAGDEATSCFGCLKVSWPGSSVMEAKAG